MHKNNEHLNFLFMGDREELSRVDAARRGLGWSWAAFAREVGESPQTVNNWRVRGIPGDKKFAVAQALGRSVEWLVTGSTKVPTESEGKSVLPDINKGARLGREPVYPTEPFNRFSRLAKLWPYLTDEIQNDVVEKLECLVKTARHGQKPPAPPLKSKRTKER